LVYFAKDLFGLASGSVRNVRGPQAKQIMLLVLATLPIVIAGVTLKRYVVGSWRSLWVISVSLIVIGVVMWLIDRNSARKVQAGVLERTIGDLNWQDALLIGLAQSVPGVSRSGATICMALLIGVSRRDAARFSFLLSIPAVGGAGILELRDALKAFGPNLGHAIPALAVGTAVAAITGYIVIAWLIKWLGSNRLTSFAWYRIAVGAALMIALAGGMLQP
jgi:undecaprenyl-diphosphatase